MNSHSRDRLPFTDFLQRLQRDGFIIGIERYLRVERLLEGADGAIDPVRLKTLLCPLFASDSNEQKRFYHLFDEYYRQNHNDETFARSTPLATATDVRQQRSQLRLWPRILLATLMLLCSLTPNRFLDPPSTPSHISNPLARPLTHNNIKPRASETMPLEVPKGSMSATFVFLDAKWFWILPMAIVSIYSIWYLQRRVTGAHLKRQQRRRHRFSMSSDSPITLPILPRARVLCNMQPASQMAETTRLDLGRTISATAAHVGFPQLCYARKVQRPEYLVLIDRTAPRDHFAKLIEDLITRLARDRQVLVDQYFFTGDPRVCINFNDGKARYLVDILARHQDQPLLIFGDGAAFWNSFTGEYVSWANLVLRRPQTVLLTPSVNAWGTREMALRRRIMLLTATNEGLTQALHWLTDNVSHNNCSSWPRATRLPEYPAMETEGSLHLYLRKLRTCVGDNAFQLLGACALYPRLEWDLTVYLASSISSDLLYQANLLTIAALPWFRKGYYPIRLQQALFNSLKKDERHIFHNRIIGFIKHEAANNTGVSSLEITVQKFGLSPKVRRILEQDEALSQLATAAGSSRFALRIPEKLRRILFRFGVPALGLRIQFIAVLLFLAASGLAAQMFFSSSIRLSWTPPGAPHGWASASIPERPNMIGSSVYPDRASTERSPSPSVSQAVAQSDDNTDRSPQLLPDVSSSSDNVIATADSLRQDQARKLLMQSYELSYQLDSYNRSYYLLTLIKKGIHIASDEKIEEWCKEMFRMAFAIPDGWNRVAQEKNALVLLSEVNPDLAIELFKGVDDPQPDPDGIFPEDVRAVGALPIMRNYWRAAKDMSGKLSRLSKIQSQAKDLGRTGEYPYRAMAYLIGELARLLDQKSGNESRTIFVEALECYRTGSPKFLNRNHEFLRFLRDIRQANAIPDIVLFRQALQVFSINVMESPKHINFVGEFRSSKGEIIRVSDDREALLIEAIPMIREFLPELATRLTRQYPVLVKAEENLQYFAVGYSSLQESQIGLLHNKFLQKSLINQIKSVQQNDLQTARALAARLTDDAIHIEGYCALLPSIMKSNPSEAKQIYESEFARLQEINDSDEHFQALVALVKGSYYLNDISNFDSLTVRALDEGLKLFDTDARKTPGSPTDTRRGYDQLTDLVTFGVEHGSYFIIPRLQEMANVELRAHLLIYAAEAISRVASQDVGR